MHECFNMEWIMQVIPHTKAVIDLKKMENTGS